MSVRTIEPIKQSLILSILPDDAELTLRLLSQLTANILLSMDFDSPQPYTDAVAEVFWAYKAEESRQ